MGKTEEENQPKTRKKKIKKNTKGKTIEGNDTDWFRYRGSDMFVLS